MLICVFTGFVSGLPLYILIQLVPAWLRVEGVGLAEIGLFALIGFPYTWKWIWAPLFDRYTLPFLGRRCGWLFVVQLALIASIVALGQWRPVDQLLAVAVMATIVAVFSATQDIVIDAFRRELLASEAELGLGNSIHTQAYRLSSFIPGSLGLVLAGGILPWEDVFTIMALFMSVGLVVTLLISEALNDPKPPETLRQAVSEPFIEFFGRQGTSRAILFPFSRCILMRPPVADRHCSKLAHIKIGQSKIRFVVCLSHICARQHPWIRQSNTLTNVKPC